MSSIAAQNLPPAKNSRSSPPRRNEARVVEFSSILLVLALGIVGTYKATPVLSWFPVDPTLIAALMVAAHIVVRLFANNGRLPRGFSHIILLWLVFLLGVLTAVLMDNDLLKAAQLYTITLLAVSAGAILFSSTRSHRLWIVGQLILSILTVILVYVLPDVNSFETGQASVEGSTTIGVGRILGAGALIAALSIILQRRFRLVGTVCLLLVFPTLLVVGNRASLIVLLATILCVIAVSRHVKASRTKLLIGGLTVVGLSIALIVSGIFTAASRVTALYSENTSGAASSQIRQDLMLLAIAEGVRNPLGVGWNGFPTLADVSGGFGQNAYPHNVVVEILVEGGWIGVIAFAVFVCVAFSRLIRNSGSVTGTITLALAFYWFGVSFFSEDINGNRMMWICLGMAFSSVTTAAITKRDRAA